MKVDEQRFWWHEFGIRGAKPDLEVVTQVENQWSLGGTWRTTTIREEDRYLTEEITDQESHHFMSQMEMAWIEKRKWRHCIDQRTPSVSEGDVVALTNTGQHRLDQTTVVGSKKTLTNQCLSYLMIGPLLLHYRILSIFYMVT